MGEALIVRKGGVGLVFETFTQEAAFNEGNLALLITGPTNPDPVRSIAADNDFVYVTSSASSGATVRKYHRGNLVDTNIASANLGGSPLGKSIFVDNDFVYVVAGSKAHKLYKSNLGTNISAPNTAIRGARQNQSKDNDYIYTSGGSVFGTGYSSTPVEKWYVSNLQYAGATENFPGGILGTITDNDFIYVSGEGSSLRKYHKPNGTLVASVATGQQGSSLVVDDNFVYYIGAGGDNLAKKYHKGNLVLASNAVSSIGGIYSVSIYDASTEFFYMIGDSYNSVQKVNVNSTSNTFSKTTTVGGLTNIRGIAIYDEFFYISVNDTLRSHQKRQVTQEAINDPEGIIVFEGNNFIKEDYTL
jgi:hypothetical protein